MDSILKCARFIYEDLKQSIVDRHQGNENINMKIKNVKINQFCKILKLFQIVIMRSYGAFC